MAFERARQPWMRSCHARCCGSSRSSASSAAASKPNSSVASAPACASRRPVRAAPAAGSAALRLLCRDTLWPRRRGRPPIASSSARSARRRRAARPARRCRPAAIAALRRRVAALRLAERVRPAAAAGSPRRRRAPRRCAPRQSPLRIELEVSTVTAGATAPSRRKSSFAAAIARQYRMERDARMREGIVAGAR